MEKIVLVMTSLNPGGFKINRALRSAIGFDEIHLHIDAATKQIPHIDLTRIEPPVIIFEHKDHLRIDQAYNEIIQGLPDDPWICCFCDDDFFDAVALAGLCQAIKNSDFMAADIIHFQVHVSGNRPYHIWGAADVNEKNIMDHNPIPAGSFFKKSAWEKARKFRGLIWHDWVMWMSAQKAGLNFKFYDQPIYWFMMRDESAAVKQLAGFDGDFEKAKASVVEYAA